MAIYQQKRVLALVLGFLCLVYAFLLFGFSARQQWVSKKMVENAVFHLQRAVLNNFLEKYRNLPINATASRKKEQAEPHPTPLEDPLQYPSETNCFPYFNELHVQPVPEHDCDQPYVTVNHAGRLGNKMCQYASLYLLRHLFGVRVSTLDEMYTTLDKIFKNIVTPVKKPACFVGKPKGISYMGLYDKLYRTAAQVLSNTSSSFIPEPLLNTSYHIYDYPRPQDLLLEHRKLIQSLFKFRDEVMENAILNINNALRSFNATYHHRDFPIVTVHVRRTDYEKHMKNLFNLTQLNKHYYTNAFKFYKKRLKRPLFLVASDDPKWCRENLLAKDVIVIASKVPAEDMAAMTLGDHHIISYGTFSFMGALLGNGNITHPLTTNPRYRFVKCIKSPVFHNVPRSKKQSYYKRR
ncbi:galactoside alpha-(1,2)-fucosyltransferase 2-like isoform X2 [Portunus trituberculatus]|uniref:galactoside alpha-(1,2)-fucosyltransferase 2-like isoform X2 n=1 Tax=Portunus trituberculatus TaxID=210409 RepID=UPI001E1CFCB4|nr:galactoside alpha-(1,2)-fucosyltransferase 2-like isoform X2 [Portunus trituberculatus]